MPKIDFSDQECNALTTLLRETVAAGTRFPSSYIQRLKAILDKIDLARDHAEEQGRTQLRAAGTVKFWNIQFGRGVLSQEGGDDVPVDYLALTNVAADQM